MKYIYLIILSLLFMFAFMAIGKLTIKIDSASTEYAKYIIEQTK